MSYGPNSVKCADCGDILTSEHVHDCKICGCDNRTMIDGGMDYRRIGGADMSKVLRWSKKRGWVSWSILQAERDEASRKKKSKPVKTITISQKEYNELNYKLRYLVGLQIRYNSLSNNLRDYELGDSLFAHINWRKAISERLPLQAMCIEDCMKRKAKLTGIKELRAAVMVITKHPFGLAAAKAAYEEWEEYLS